MSLEESACIVAVNDQDQHAVWEADLALPAGWRQQSAAMSKVACLAAISTAWRDIAPVSVREAKGETGRRPESKHGTKANDPIPHNHTTRLVPGLFEEQASRRPHSAAVADPQTQLTYGQLDQSANQLAHQLREMGVGPETLVGVCLERGVDAIRGLLATWKAGGGYLPLDPSFPPARLAQMCREARPVVVLLRSADASAFGETDARLLLIDEEPLELADQPTTAPGVSLHPDNLAYAIYTSGSTGSPKAVAVSHGALACTSQELSGTYRMSPRDRVVQLAALAFDTSIEQILVTLLNGSTLLLPSAGTVAPADLLRYLAREQVTVVDLTPAYWHRVLALAEPDDERLRSVRLMITGGDAANSADCTAARRAVPGAKLLNAYGLTETTITSTLFEVGGGERVDREGVAGASALVPAGRPLGHTRVLVLDEMLNAVPAGEVGEIYLGGCGVARGYLGQPGLTAERFLPDRDGVVPGARMYRTGDLGRWDADGNLLVIDRADRQLKIRGYRVEPAEIEEVLASHPEVDEAAVIARESGAGGAQLAAYYTRRPGGQHGSASDRMRELPSGMSLRSFLSARVPGFMVPDTFTALEQMPLTPGGKLDRRALPDPAMAGGAGTPGEAGMAGSLGTAAGRRGDGDYTLVQEGMAELWSGILSAERVGLDDDFFALGGNSLLAAEMLARVRVMFGIGPDWVRPLTRCLLRDPSLRGFSNATQDARAGRLAAAATAARVDFAREAELAVPVRRSAGPPPDGQRPDWQRPREILLTGSTGFLGVHLLHELLAATTARVHCLVRARDAGHARQRIAEAADRYSLDGLALDRVVPVPGDLAEPALGLSPGTFRELARTVDVIHHAGAAVNFIYPYEELRAANVSGTRELIRLAGLYRAIPLHFVSTTAVLAGFGAAGVREVTEDSALGYAENLCMGYLETKFVAEELVRNAGRAGLPVAIYRPLDIAGDQRTGTWNTATEMCALIRFITDTGLAPDIDLTLDFVPADTCAAAISYISSHRQAAGFTYHLASPQYALLGALVDRLRQHGFAIEEIPYRDWVGELLRYAAQHPAHPMTPFVPLFVDRCCDLGLTVAEMYLKDIFPAYTRSRTEQALSGSGIAFPPVDAKLLDLNITRLIATGYLTNPGAAGYAG